MKTNSIIHDIELRFIGPTYNKNEAIKVLKSLGFVDISNCVPWEEAFPDYDKPEIALAGARNKEGLTQKELSKLTGIPQGNISDMENGKRKIGVKLAKKLGKILNVNYKIFL